MAIFLPPLKSTSNVLNFALAVIKLTALNVALTVIASIHLHVVKLELLNEKRLLHGQVADVIFALSDGESNVRITAWPPSAN